jgi:hypothetical protein
LLLFDHVLQSGLLDQFVSQEIPHKFHVLAPASGEFTKSQVMHIQTPANSAASVFTAYLRRRLHYDLHCIIDTAGKSLHGWFDAPRNKVFENRLKAGLVAFGCDPKVFTYSQPVRVPGAWWDGKLQRLLWLRE